MHDVSAPINGVSASANGTSVSTLSSNSASAARTSSKKHDKYSWEELRTHFYEARDWEDREGEIEGEGEKKIYCIHMQESGGVSLAMYAFSVHAHTYQHIHTPRENRGAKGW